MFEAAHRDKKLDGALLMSPANPTGAMIEAEELARICAFCDDAGIVFVSDEIYHGLEYAAPAQTALRHSNRAIVVNSFSKYYAMTGWRLGWLVAPQELMRPLGAPAAIARDLRADAFAGGGARRLRRGRRTGSEPRRLCAKPRSAGRPAPKNGP